MPDLFKFSNSFEPILLEGMTCTLLGTGLPREGLNVRCVSTGALPEYVHDFGALTAATWTNGQQDTNLEMNIMELSQLRMRVMDPIKIRISNPTAVRQWQTKRVQFYLPQFPTEPGLYFFQEHLWKMSEFFIFEDNLPAFDLYSDDTAATSRIIYSGWRFTLEKIAEIGKFPLWISEWPSISPQLGRFSNSGNGNVNRIAARR
jgi:hypothetical protein